MDAGAEEAGHGRAVVELPPQPSPSAIEVTCEDDPLTLEWRVPLGKQRRAMTIGAWLLLMALPLALGAWQWRAGGWSSLLVLPILGALFLWTLRAGTRQILRLADVVGEARLVLHSDSLILVPGGGAIPQVLRRSEISRIDIDLPGRVALVIEDEKGLRHPLALEGCFTPGDLPWLAEVLKRWHAGTA